MRPETDGELLDLTGPAALLGFGHAFAEVLGNRVKPVKLCGVHAEHGTADAGVLMFAGRPVGAGTGAELDPPQREVFLELVPLLGSGFAVLLEWPGRTAPVDEGPVGADQVVLEDRGVGPGAVQVPVAEDPGRDV